MRQTCEDDVRIDQRSPANVLKVAFVVLSAQRRHPGELSVLSLIDIVGDFVTYAFRVAQTANGRSQPGNVVLLVAASLRSAWARPVSGTRHEHVSAIGGSVGRAVEEWNALVVCVVAALRET